MPHMRVRREDEGPSSGIETAGEAVALRELRFCDDDLLVSRDAVEALAEIRPGML